MIYYIKGLLRFTPLLRELVVRDIKVKYRKSVLGIVWSLLNPLLMMIVISFVFGNLFKSEIPNFPLYYLTGYLLFNYVSEVTTNGLFSITGNASLIKKVYVPKYLFTLSKAASSTIIFIFSLLALIIVIPVLKVKLHMSIIALPLLLFYVFLFVSGLALILSTASVFFRDIVHLWNVIMTAWMYATPLFYPISIIPDNIIWLFRLNPLYYYINYFRNIVLYGNFMDLKYNLACFITGLITFCVGLFIFYKTQAKFILNI